MLFLSVRHPHSQSVQMHRILVHRQQFSALDAIHEPSVRHMMRLWSVLFPAMNYNEAPLSTLDLIIRHWQKKTIKRPACSGEEGRGGRQEGQGIWLDSKCQETH